MKIFATNNNYLTYDLFKNSAILIVKLAISILIVPLLFPCYHLSIRESYQRIILSKTVVLLPKKSLGLGFKEVIESVKKAEKYKNIINILKDISKVTGKVLSVTSWNYFLRFKNAVANFHLNDSLIQRSMGKNSLGPSVQWSFYMPGLAFIATYLKRKNKGLENLYVCDSLVAFQQKLRSIAASSVDERVSLIIPTRSLIFWWKDYNYQSQHKVAICIEKKEGKLKIAILDSQPKNDRQLSKGNFLKPIEQLALRCDETILWFILNSGINLKNTKLFYSQVLRENAGGCETFALKDGVNFLQNQFFFEHIELSSHPLNFDTFKIDKINLLPPQFMKGTQSMKALETYILAYGDVPIRHGKEVWSLKECVRKHEIWNQQLNKKQNHYVCERSYKYHLIYMEALENMCTQELVDCIKESLIEAPQDQIKDHTIVDDLNYLYNKV